MMSMLENLTTSKENDSACHMEYPPAICNVTAIIDVNISLVKCGFSPHMVGTTVTCYWCCPHGAPCSYTLHPLLLIYANSKDELLHDRTCMEFNRQTVPEPHCALCACSSIAHMKNKTL